MKARIGSFLLGFALLTSTAGLASAAATGVLPGFNSANRLYEQGKYAEAASGYEKILESGAASPALYFNMGNACFKAGQLGRAVYAYRKAQALAPHDPDVQANLEFTRNQVQGPTWRASRWEEWLGTLTLNEWAWLASVALWVTFLLMTVRQFKPVKKRTLRNTALATGCATILFGALFGCAFAHHRDVKTAVVVKPKVLVHTGPFAESQDSFTAHDGAELRILDRKDDWLQVSDGTRRIGWLKQSDVLLPDSSNVASREKPVS